MFARSRVLAPDRILSIDAARSSPIVCSWCWMARVAKRSPRVTARTTSTAPAIAAQYCAVLDPSHRVKRVPVRDLAFSVVFLYSGMSCRKDVLTRCAARTSARKFLSNSIQNQCVNGLHCSAENDFNRTGTREHPCTGQIEKCVAATIAAMSQDPHAPCARGGIARESVANVCWSARVTVTWIKLFPWRVKPVAQPGRVPDAGHGYTLRCRQVCALDVISSSLFRLVE